jgi:hypothetical protein
MTMAALKLGMAQNPASFSVGQSFKLVNHPYTTASVGCHWWVD